MDDNCFSFLFRKNNFKYLVKQKFVDKSGHLLTENEERKMSIKTKHSKLFKLWQNKKVKNNSFHIVLNESTKRSIIDSNSYTDSVNKFRQNIQNNFSRLFKEKTILDNKESITVDANNLFGKYKFLAKTSHLINTLFERINKSLSLYNNISHKERNKT